MHRTTINLDEAIFRRVQAVAKRRGKSLARTIEELLRVALSSGQTPQSGDVPVHKRNGPLPGVDVADRYRLYDRMEGR